MIPQDALYLYNLTLKQPSLPYKSIVGQFSGSKKQQELVLVSTTVIEVYQPKPDTGKLHKLSLQPTFGIVQNADKLRLIGTQQDVLVLTADSGNIIVAYYNEETSKFEPRIQEPHSKNGLRRITPGEYLAVNPQNSALMIGALERTKFMYKVEMGNDSGKIKLSSPLECQSSGILTLDLCALDTSYENPLWAAIEVDYNDYETKTYNPGESPLQLRYYEFDQGLNHIVQRKSKSLLPSHATSLVALPGHIGGVLVLCESYCIYEKGPGHDRVYLPLPIRKGSSTTKIICHYLHVLKKRDFFILLQSSLGDLFKVTFDFNKETEEINQITSTYFDSIPVCNSISILKSGFLFSNVANDSKLFYQFEKLGSENESTMTSITEVPKIQDSYQFAPQGLENLALVDILESLGPVTGSEVMQTQTKGHSDAATLLATLSSHSYLKSLTYGIPVSELVSSPLPITPTLILTTKQLSTSKSDDYLVLSSTLNSQTLVLSIGEVVEEVSESGFVTDQNTITVQQVGKQSIVQIHTNGIRHIRHILDESGEIIDKKTTDWLPPAGINIVHASANEAQVLVGLSNRELCYFEIDPSDDQLGEYQERHEIGSDLITAVAILTGSSTMKSDFAVIGCADETIQVISLHPNSVFEMLTLQALSSKCTSLLMLPLDNNSAHIHIGMESGVYARVQMDTMTGKLRDTRLKYMGTKPVTLSKLNLPTLDLPGIMAISSRPWIGYQNVEGQFKLMPLIGSVVTSGLSFYSEDIGTESVVGISGNNLIIFTIGSEETGFNVNDEFSMSLVKLRFQPRKHLKDTKTNNIIVLESEADTISPYTALEEEVDEDYYQAFGFQRSVGSWASCIQVVNYDNEEISQTIPFDNNECFTAMCLASFNDEEYIMAASSSSTTKNKPSHTLHVFKLKRGKDKSLQLNFVHKTEVDGPISAMANFQERLLVGIGNTLRLYDLGQKQMLRKSFTGIDFLRRPTQMRYLGGDLVVVSDSSESISYFKFDASANQFILLCNDMMRRQVTAFEMLDFRTVVGGDKFGNIFVSRLPDELLNQLSNNALLQFDEDLLDAPSTRLEKICEFYIADVPTSFSKGTFVVGGTEGIVYTGLQGSVGLLIPVATKLEAELLSSLEVELRSYFSPEFDDFDKTKQGFNLLGKDQWKFRSYFNPSKNTIDGDFAERFYEVPLAQRIRIAEKLGRTPREIEKKLYDIRNRSAF